VISKERHIEKEPFVTGKKKRRDVHPFTKLPHCQSICKLPHCRSETSNFYFNVGARILKFKFEVKFNKFAFLHSKYYLHEIAEQEEDMKFKRILLTAREKQGVVNYCLERRELTLLT
jgi:hypothetical protein